MLTAWQKEAKAELEAVRNKLASPARIDLVINEIDPSPYTHRQELLEVLKPILMSNAVHPYMPIMGQFELYNWFVKHYGLAEGAKMRDAIRESEQMQELRKHIEDSRGKVLSPYCSQHFAKMMHSAKIKRAREWAELPYMDNLDIFLKDMLKNPVMVAQVKDLYRLADYAHPTSKFYRFDWTEKAYKVYDHNRPASKGVYCKEGIMWEPTLIDAGCTVYDTHRANSIDQAESMLNDMVHPRNWFYKKFDRDRDDWIELPAARHIRFSAATSRVMDAVYYDMNKKAAEELLKKVSEDVIDICRWVSDQFANGGVIKCDCCGHKETVWDYNCPTCSVPNERCIRAKWDLESYETAVHDDEGNETETVGANTAVCYEVDFDYLDNVGGEDPDVEPIYVKKDRIFYRIPEFMKLGYKSQHRVFINIHKER